MESGKHIGKSQQSIGAIPIAISSVFVTVTMLWLYETSCFSVTLWQQPQFTDENIFCVLK